MGTEKQRQNTDELTHVGGSKPQKINSYCLCLVRCLTGSLGFPKCERLLCPTYHTNSKKLPITTTTKKPSPPTKKTPHQNKKQKTPTKKPPN